jgi:sugar-specific transcriptional regulator TrmB
MQEDMLKKQEEIKNEYEEKIQTDKETREREDQEKKRKQDIQQRFMNGTVAIANKLKEQTRQIEEYVRLFSSNHGRNPLKEEIRDALKTKLDEDILTKYLAKYGGSDSINLEIDEQDDSMV